MIHTPPTSYESYPSSFSTKVLEQHQSIVIVPKLEPESLPAVVKPKKKYIPPHLRKNFKAAPPSSTEKESTNPKSILSGMFDTTDDANTNTYKPKIQTKTKKEIVITSEYQPHPSLKLGGCADTTLFGSILETIHQQSILVQQPTNKIIYPYKSNAYGDFSPSKNTYSRWEVGAVSERGVREANEDAFLICNDLASFDTTKEKEGISTSVYPNPSSLFAIFDGHFGDQGARYAAETFTTFLQESILLQQNDPNSSSSNYAMEEALKHAIYRLDTSLCAICQEGGRDWGCGATALITLVLEDKLILANVGDCRGVFCTSTLPPETSDWNELPHTSTNGTTTTNTNPHKSYHWKSITKVHTPSRPSEKTRIEQANGWITVEHESCLAGQLHRMDFCDDDVVNILKRWFSDRFDIKNDTNGHADADNANCERSADSADPKRILKISRVCGELSVSRALGDCDFKAAFNPSTNNNDDDNTQHKSSWEGPDFLPYPKTHSQRFHDDLISGIPDVETMTIIPGFLILDCDGLWDVMDPYDAVRVTKDLIYDKGWNAKKAAARLAELAIHLGSSDNTTVILIRFYDCEDNTDNCASTNEVKCNR